MCVMTMSSEADLRKFRVVAAVFMLMALVVVAGALFGAAIVVLPLALFPILAAWLFWPARFRRSAPGLMGRFKERLFKWMGIDWLPGPDVVPKV